MEQVPSSLATQIDDIAARLETAFNAIDAVGLASLYSDTAVLMPPNEPMVRGKREIQTWFERVLPRLGGVRIVPIKSSAVAGEAIQVGTFISTPKMAEPSSSVESAGVPQTGKYVLLLQKEAGHWKISYDIWNLDRPAG